MHLLSFRDVLAHRLIAQALVTPRPDAAAHMLAVQDQIHAAGVTALQKRSDLTVRDARWAVELAGDRAVPVTIEGSAEQLFAAPEAGRISAEQLQAALGTELDLPAFDEYLIGCRDRSEFLPAELVPIVGPTKNGRCRPFRVRDGMIAAAE